MSRSTLAATAVAALCISLLSCNSGQVEAPPPSPPAEVQHLPSGESLARFRLVVDADAQGGETIYLYAGDYLLGPAPLDEEVHLTGGTTHDLHAVVATPDRGLAPFYAQTRTAAARQGEQQTISFEIPELEGYGQTDGATGPQYDLPPCSDSFSGDMVIAAQVRELELERVKLEKEVREVSFSPLFQQLSLLYNAASNSPPRQESMVFRGVPVWTVVGEVAKSKEINLALTAGQFRQLGKWMAKDKFRLEEKVARLEAMKAHAQGLMGRARECAAQKALEAAYFESRMIQETLDNAINALRGVESTAENLAGILEKAAADADSR